MPASTHGGPRKGAGRKPTGRKAFLVRVKPATMRNIRAQAKAAGQSVPEFLDSTFGS